MTESEPHPNRFDVHVRGLEHLRGIERKVVYHGVNKSGSLVMTNVLFHGYHAANRANQFFSTYRNFPSDLGYLRTLINQSTGHAFFGGHYLYGAYRSRPDEHLLTTQFRNPLPRVRSAYQWLSNKHAAEADPFASFEDWVVQTRGVLHSQVAQFGLGFGPEARGLLNTVRGEELLERALVNIDRDVDWFGIAEYFEESAFCMASICGLPTIRPWQMDNRNKDRPLVTEWPQEHIDLVRDVFKWDFILYDWALERFRTNIDSLEFGSELDRYKQACADQYKDRLGADGAALAGETLGSRAIAPAELKSNGVQDSDVVTLLRDGALARIAAAEQSRQRASSMLVRADVQMVHSMREAVASGLLAREIAERTGTALEDVIALAGLGADD